MKPLNGDGGRKRDPRRRTLLRRLSSSGFWAAVGRVSGTVGHILVLVAVAHLLPDVEVGVYVVCYSTAMIGAVLAMFGLKPAIIRTVRPAIAAGATGPIRQFMVRAAMLFAGAAVIVSLVLTTAALALGDSFARGNLVPYLPWLITWIVVAAASQLLGDVFRGLEQFRWGTFIGGESGGMLANPLLLVVILVLSQWDDVTVAMILSCHVVIGTAQLAIALLAVVAATSSGAGGDHVRSHPVTTQATIPWILSQSWPNLISHVLAHGIAHIGIIVFATFGAEHDVAAFGVIRRLMLLVGAPLQLLNVALSPFVVELHSEDRIRELQSLLRVTATLAAIPSLAVLAVIMALPSTILRLFGEQYATAAIPLMVLGASNLIFVLCGSNTLTLRMTGWQIVSMSNGLITGSIYLMTLPTIIERYGILGAAGAAATLLAVRNLSSTLLVRKFVGVWPVPILWPAKFMREFGVLRRQHSVANSV